jgi:hypothetical protein
MDRLTPLMPASASGRLRLQATMKYGRVLKGLTLEQLSEMVRLLGPGSPFVVVERMDDTEGNYYVQACHRDDGTWIVEYRDGDRSHHYQADASGPGAVYRVLAGWALQLPGWRQGVTWRPVYQ